MYKNQISNREILKPTKALLVRAFISDFGFGRFLRGFSVSTRPLRPLLNIRRLN